MAIGTVKKDQYANPHIGQVDGTILNVANGDLGNSDTSYTYIEWASKGFKLGVIQLTIEATTVTIEATTDPSSVADGDATWVDVTNSLFGVANLTATGVLIIDTPVLFARLRIKRVTTNATNSIVGKLSRSN